MDRIEADKIIKQEIREDRALGGHFDMITWLYAHGYQIVKTARQTKPQSKFMEEWFEYWEHLETEFPKINNWHIFVKIMMLIDKHKADKEDK